jgi:putative tryptophan/tyrosine transport system substrate-binding protein
MRRRDFITLLGGAAAAWPLAARAQQRERVRRIGVLMPHNENDSVAKSWLFVLMQQLRELGWTDGRNLQVASRWAAGDSDRMQRFAKELVDFQPNVIFAVTSPATAAVQRETRTIPIVFAGVSDPVGSGFVTSLGNPGGNVTGFTNIEAAMAGKSLELLMEVAREVKHVAIMFNPDTAPGGGLYFLPAAETAAQSLKTALIRAPVRSEAEMEKVMTTLVGGLSDGIIVMSDVSMQIHRARIISLAAVNKVPAIYPQRVYALDGGLLSYGADTADLFRRAAPYLDRILRGAKPEELPVQMPTKFELVINLKTARALGLDVPPTLLARADEVIE